MSTTRMKVVLMAAMVTVARGNYKCLCNYDVECAVREQPVVTGLIQGYLYEFDCKPVLGDTGVNDWFPIAMEHQVGYVHGCNYQIQTCPGQPPAVDVVASTSHTSPSSPAPTTTTSTTSTKATMTTSPTSATPAPTTTTMLKTTQPQTTTTQAPTRVTTQAPTTRIANLTIHPPTTPQQQQLTTGNVKMCPAILHQYTLEDKGALTQYGNRCFEIVPIRAIWARAENDCRAKGGHLFHIENAGQQDFIYKWIKSYNFDHAVWTGLNDLLNEEYFQWISGDHLLFTNWYPDRYGNLASHHIENCVLLVPYAPYYGQWDDVQCGINTLFGDSGQQNPFICEWVITPHHNAQAPLAVVG